MLIIGRCCKCTPPSRKSVQRTLAPRFIFKPLHTKTDSDEYREFSRSPRRFMAPCVLLLWQLRYPSNWKCVSSAKKKRTVRHISSFLWNKSGCRLQDCRATGGQQKRRNKLNDSADAEASVVTEGQLVLFFFQYLQMSDLWVGAYSVYPV